MTAEIRRSWVKDPSKIRDATFLLEFLTEEEAKKQKEERLKNVDPEVEASKKVAIEKASWGIITGRFLKNKKVKKRKSNYVNPTNTSNPRRPPDAKRK